ncbi:T9SS type A sorting domain-containing protein [candidate division KSB1 bacterium]|nr:T9SS type A sorting domain-containing protein [candidate division KSB1 bacterium]
MPRNQKLTSLLLLYLCLSATSLFSQIPDFIIRNASHIGGRANSTTMLGDYLFVAQGSSVGVFDLNDPDLNKLISFPMPRSVEQILILNQTAILRLSDPDSSILIFDMQNPEQPQRISAVPVLYRWDGRFHASDSYICYMIPDSLYIIDYSLPAAPVISTLLETPCTGMFCTQRHLFVTGGDSLKIFNMGNLSRPRLQSALYAKGCTTVLVYGNMAYVGFEDRNNLFFGIKIYNISDKSNPVELGEYATKIVEGNSTFHQNPQFTRVQNNTMYVVCSSLESYLFIADISDPTNPAEKGIYQLSEQWSQLKSLEVDFPYLYLAMGADSEIIKKYDISDPAGIKKLDGIRAPQNIFHVASKKNILFVAAEDNFLAYRFPAPGRPVLLASAPEFAGMTFLATRLDYTLGIKEDTLFIIKTMDPNDVAAVKTLVFPGYPLSKIALRDSTEAYVITNDEENDSRLISIDITDPPNAAVLNDIVLAGHARDVSAPNDTPFVYIAYYNGEADKGVKVFDTSDPENPKEAATAQSMYSPSAICGNKEEIFIASNDIEPAASLKMFKSNKNDLKIFENEKGAIQSFNHNGTNGLQPGASAELQYYIWDMVQYGQYIMASVPHFGLIAFDAAGLLEFFQWYLYYALDITPLFFCGRPQIGIVTTHGSHKFNYNMVWGYWGVNIAGVQYTPFVRKIEAKSDKTDLQVGEQTQFTATGYDRWGNETANGFTWHASGGKIDAATGIYTATEAGDFKVWCVDDKTGVQSNEVNVHVHFPAHVEKKSSEIKEFKLYPNYPNPFNPVTTICFDVKVTTEVQLQVFNTRGQLVQTLVNGTVQSGSHTVFFNGTKFPNGVYYYKIIMGGFEKIQKMVLLK